MPRESFHRELDRLVEKVVELGREVESCLDTMVGALEKHDAEVASHRLGVDAHYKERGTQIIEECMILQARQAPVAQDLRLIHVLQAVTNTWSVPVLYASISAKGSPRPETPSAILT